MRSHEDQMAHNIWLEQSPPRVRRMLLRWTRYRLCQASGLNDSTVEDLECGRVSSPTLRTFTKLANALGVSRHQLIEEWETWQRRRPTEGKGAQFLAESFGSALGYATPAERPDRRSSEATDGTGSGTDRPE